MALGLRFAIIMLIGLYCAFVFSDNVPPAYAKIAQQYQVPAEVLYAIALTESGRDSNGVYRPWPWTLNVGGKAKFYKTREQAQAALDEAIAKNVRPLGVGLMQIEWPIHHARVSNSAQMLDPITNLHTGGQILTEYRKNKNLWAAVGRYHSGTPDLAKGYRARVAKRLINFLERRYDTVSTVTNDASLSLRELP